MDGGRESGSQERKGGRKRGGRDEGKDGRDGRERGVERWRMRGEMREKRGTVRPAKDTGKRDLTEDSLNSN